MPTPNIPPHSKLSQAWELWKNMGPRYVAFRALWELRRRSGWLKRDFPTDPPRETFTTLAEWRANPAWHLLPQGRPVGLPALSDKERERLVAAAERILEGEVPFFSSTWLDLGTDWDWHTHPETDYRYPKAHWTQIADFSARAGDIKLVWEKARFSWVYTLARAEMRGGPEAGAFVLGQIAHFIAHNPLNRGPQYRCSQETSLRVLAWSFALSFWRDHAALTEPLFQDILHHIRWQLHHVRAAIHFSRIAVRNNHAITETAMLALSRRLFPFFPQTARWAEEGLQWLEEEVAYQIHDDGTYLQHSMNYHRVVVQTLTLVLSPCGLGLGAVSETFRQRAAASVDFLRACQDEVSGWLPNYGNNDGALFFPLSSCHYRDYRPALEALNGALGRPSLYGEGAWREEGVLWNCSPGPSDPDFDLHTKSLQMDAPSGSEGPGLQLEAFAHGGYVAIKTAEGQTLTFLRAAAYTDRPAQADNLHLDLWHQGHNLLRDAGTYKYNTDAATLSKFVGSAAHNTVTLDGLDHMLKGPRFIWYHWPKEALLRIREDGLRIRAQVDAYAYLTDGPTVLRRTVQLHPTDPIWVVEDEASDALKRVLIQHWHPLAGWEEYLSFEAVDSETGRPLEMEVGEGCYSSYYGRKETAPHLIFRAPGKRIRTTISLKKALPALIFPDSALEE